MQQRVGRFNERYPWPRSQREQTICFVTSRALEVRSRGPSNTASGRRISPKDGPQDAGQYAAGTWACRRRTPADASES
ncbi:MAG: hypothetical protein OJF55_001690 [Rhodanobacteraceae bacterium]|nr:MAG: hypothetical protein OJF55_001690 [Rhodanobacteraceae bacterium]